MYKCLGIFIGLLLLSACGLENDFELSMQKASIERQDRLDYAYSNNIPFLIVDTIVHTPNSAGGVDVSIVTVNTSPDKGTIKYLEFDILAYNSVGDPAGGEIRKSSRRSLQATGPYKVDVTERLYWETLYYNYSINCVVITKLTITYMDNSKRSYSGSKLKKLMGRNNKNSCNYEG